MQGQNGFWDVEDRLKELSAEGDPLDTAFISVPREIPLPELTELLGADGGPQKGIEDGLLDRCRALERRDGIPVAD